MEPLHREVEDGERAVRRTCHAGARPIRPSRSTTNVAATRRSRRARYSIADAGDVAVPLLRDGLHVADRGECGDCADRASEAVDGSPAASSSAEVTATPGTVERIGRAPLRRAGRGSARRRRASGCRTMALDHAPRPKAAADQRDADEAEKRRGRRRGDLAHAAGLARRLDEAVARRASDLGRGGRPRAAGGALARPDAVVQRPLVHPASLERLAGRPLWTETLWDSPSLGAQAALVRPGRGHDRVRGVRGWRADGQRAGAVLSRTLRGRRLDDAATRARRPSAMTRMVCTAMAPMPSRCWWTVVSGGVVRGLRGVVEAHHAPDPPARRRRARGRWRERRRRSRHHPS